AHAITSDVPLDEQVRTAEFMGAEAVVVTGSATGRSVDRQELEQAAAASTLPTIVGSGACRETVAELLDTADAVIVGSAAKLDGRWQHGVDAGRAAGIVEAARSRHP
ncbi:MAG: BtpA/SgcQ family protein, partial [Planctomycetota bacterium]|nr:BtpA/SgcQ family protein [Planctomycetota bacterium]